MRFEQHARKRMRQRGVTEQDVAKTVRDPDRRGKARRAGAQKLERKLSNRRRIIVIVE